jgi:polyphosphate kinase
MADENLYNRELSWLSFNHRVLQEAKDTRNPVYERIKFLAIYSSNQDEFFRVRVASLRSLLDLKKKTQKELKFDPVKLLEKIHKKVLSLHEENSHAYHHLIIPDLEKNNIFLINENGLNDVQKDYIKEVFNDQIVPHILPMILVKKKFTTFLRNNRLYLAVKLTAKNTQKGNLEKTGSKKRHYHALVEIPTNHLPRFITLPKSGDNNYIIFLDDVIRYFLPIIFFGYNIHSAYSIKLTRDAELYIEDEFTGNLLSKIKKSLNKRLTGVPCRFLYDKTMPAEFIRFLIESLILTKEDLYPGGKYHNFSDLFKFPNPGNKALNYEPLSSIINKEYEKHKNIFLSIKKQDYLFYFPYQSYDYVVKALNKASEDPKVKSIKITQYRVAKHSAVVNALIRAAHKGKDVTAFVEVKARFDEEINIQSAERMQREGVKVLYSLPGLKVHAKMCLISRLEKGVLKNYAYLATGNFNEITAKLYCDYGFFTSDENLTEEVERVFNFLEGKQIDGDFKHLLVAQFNMRKVFTGLIDNEIKNAKEGKPAYMILKMNSLEDERIIRKLYEASQAGIKIQMIVRGISCLIPGVQGLSENISIISIVDRFLEHGRIFLFANGGNEIVYLSSADWMKRNLSRRIEVAFPVYDEKLKQELKDILLIQLNDNVKARIIDEKQQNKYVINDPEKQIQSQYEIFEYLKRKNRSRTTHL